jgi:hypothetical protein
MKTISRERNTFYKKNKKSSIPIPKFITIMLNSNQMYNMNKTPYAV